MLGVPVSLWRLYPLQTCFMMIQAAEGIVLPPHQPAVSSILATAEIGLSISVMWASNCARTDEGFALLGQEDGTYTYTALGFLRAEQESLGAVEWGVCWDPEELGFCFSSLTSCLYLPWHFEFVSVHSLSVFIQAANSNKVPGPSFVLRSLRKQASKVIWVRTFYNHNMKFFHLNGPRQWFERMPACLSRAVIQLNHSGNLEP